MDKINIYINSKNRKENENANKFTVKIPNNLLRLNRDEYFTLNVNGTYTLSTCVFQVCSMLPRGVGPHLHPRPESSKGGWDRPGPPMKVLSAREAPASGA